MSEEGANKIARFHMTSVNYQKLTALIERKHWELLPNGQEHTPPEEAPDILFQSREQPQRNQQREATIPPEDLPMLQGVLQLPLTTGSHSHPSAIPQSASNKPSSTEKASHRTSSLTNVPQASSSPHSTVYATTASSISHTSKSPCQPGRTLWE